MLPDGAKQWVADHPRVLVGLCAGLVAFNAFNLYRSTELLVRAKSLIADAQIAASERLGG